jgi:8-oxo-dGTP pyrophosphatase MutT (NUDIX family)
MKKRFTRDEDRIWVNNLPAKRTSAKVFVWNQDDELLLVKPSYRDYWQLPGGVIEAGESPHEAALRELDEETGIVKKLKDLEFYGVSYSPPQDGFMDFVHFFFGAHVKNDIRLFWPESEIESAEFHTLQEVRELIGDEAVAHYLRLAKKGKPKERGFYAVSDKKVL